MTIVLETCGLTIRLFEVYRFCLKPSSPYRPFFTYFVTFVQLVVMILACSGYGLAPFGLNLEREVAGEVVVPSSLEPERVCRIEDENPWIGPRQADLIRIGARFSPCMRRDETLHNIITETQQNWDRR